MKKIAQMKIKLRNTGSSGIFHDSRTDARILAQAISAVIEKQNEIIVTVNKLIDLQNKSNAN